MIGFKEPGTVPTKRQAAVNTGDVEGYLRALKAEAQGPSRLPGFMLGLGVAVGLVAFFSLIAI